MENCSSQTDVPLSSSHAVPLIQLGSPAVSRLGLGSGKCHWEKWQQTSTARPEFGVKKTETEQLSGVKPVQRSQLLMLLGSITVIKTHIVLQWHKYAAQNNVSQLHLSFSPINHYCLVPPVEVILKVWLDAVWIFQGYKMWRSQLLFHCTAEKMCRRSFLCLNVKSQIVLSRGQMTFWGDKQQGHGIKEHDLII